MTAKKTEIALKQAKRYIESLCRRFGLESPEIVSSAHSTENLTSPKRISLGKIDPKTTSPWKVALHVFGHWLCDLHADPDHGDRVADTIAKMVERIDELEFRLSEPDRAEIAGDEGV